jgi:hypothetical protein
MDYDKINIFWIIVDKVKHSLIFVFAKFIYFFYLNQAY